MAMRGIVQRGQGVAERRSATDGRRRSAVRVAASLLGTVLLLVVAGPAATAAVPATAPQGTGASTDFQFSAEPFAAPGAQQRSYFSYQLQPGHRILDQVVVLNKSSAPESFVVYPEDATNVPNTGGYAYQARNKMHNTTVGLWVTVGNSSFTVPAGDQVVVTFQLAVPANAPPGDHVGAVVVEEQHGAQAQNPVGVNLVLRFAVPLFVHVVGPLHPAMTVENLTVFHQSPLFPYLSGSAKVAVRFDVVNTGNDILNPDTVTVSITGLLSGTLHTFTLKQSGLGPTKTNPLPVQMLPGARLQLTELWQGLPPFDPLTAHVSVRATDPNSNLPVSTSASELFWYFPWLPVLIVLAIVAALLYRRWRRRHPRGASGEGGAASDTTSDAAGPDGAAEDPAREEAGV